MSNSKFVASADPHERLNQYLKHFVGLAWVDAPSHPDSMEPRRGQAVSGFVVSIAGEWIWITAGHVLSDIEKMLNQGRKFEGIKFIDGWNRKRIDDVGFPFPYEFPMPHLYDKNLGIDYGMILLGDQPRALLEANGIQPIDESQFQSESTAHSKFEMVGLPVSHSCWNFETKPTRISVSGTVSPTLAPIQRTEPPQELIKPFRRFYGRLVDKTSDGLPNGDVLEDIDGMSGGPIFALGNDENGHLLYSLIAVQSSWLKSKRVIAACPIDVLAKYMSRLIPQIKKVNEILPLVLDWVGQEEQLCHLPLTEAEKAMATEIGVKEVDRVRLRYEDKLPVPPVVELRETATQLGMISDETGALTFDHSIVIRADQRSNRSLLAHELKHVAQYEALGRERFLRVYIIELMTVGYPNGSLELAAIDAASQYGE